MRRWTWKVERLAEDEEDYTMSSDLYLEEWLSLQYLSHAGAGLRPTDCSQLH
jgi:hypothetical protein